MVSTSPEVTQEFAEKLADQLIPGSILTLYGELGSGKTTFIQGLAEKLGIKKRVLSPTFVFVRSYQIDFMGAKIFHHVDLYRANNLIDAKSVGIEDIIEDKTAITAIEWPEKIASLLPKETIKIRFTKKSGSEREVEIS